MQLVFEAPSKDTPGFLKRLKKAMAFQDAMKRKEVTEKTIDDMVGFLAPYIKNVSLEEATEYLLDASEAQFMEMLDAIIPDTEQPEKNEYKPAFGSKGRVKHH